MEQLKLADYLYTRGDYINAFAWAETARYQSIVEAEQLKMQLWDLIPTDQKIDAQNLARKFRVTYTKKY